MRYLHVKIKYSKSESFDFIRRPWKPWLSIQVNFQRVFKNRKLGQDCHSLKYKRLLRFFSLTKDYQLEKSSQVKVFKLAWIFFIFYLENELKPLTALNHVVKMLYSTAVEIKQRKLAFQFGTKIVLDDCTDFHGKNPTIKHYNDVTNLRKHFWWIFSKPQTGTTQRPRPCTYRRPTLNHVKSKRHAVKRNSCELSRGSPCSNPFFWWAI